MYRSPRAARAPRAWAPRDAPYTPVCRAGGRSTAPSAPGGLSDATSGALRIRRGGGSISAWAGPASRVSPPPPGVLVKAPSLPPSRTQPPLGPFLRVVPGQRHCPPPLLGLRAAEAARGSGRAGGGGSGEVTCPERAHAGLGVLSPAPPGRGRLGPGIRACGGSWRVREREDPGRRGPIDRSTLKPTWQTFLLPTRRAAGPEASTAHFSQLLLPFCPSRCFPSSSQALLRGGGPTPAGRRSLCGLDPPPPL